MPFTAQTRTKTRRSKSRISSVASNWSDTNQSTTDEVLSAVQQTVHRAVAHFLLGRRHDADRRARAAGRSELEPRNPRTAGQACVRTGNAMVATTTTDGRRLGRAGRT